MVRAGQTPESPGTPHTASATSANPATVAAISTRATGRRADAGSSHDRSMENCGTSGAR